MVLVDATINFHVNGKAYSVENPEFGVSLNSWLRSSARLTGTKVMCAEGGCGACVVMVTRSDPKTSQSKSFSANSCLLPLLSVDGCHITTTEGLIENGGQYNAIQERVAHFNATQCGYCTPGFVMTMHSLLQRNPNPTKAEIEAEFGGNLCRCTGYRPIFDAMKSFASDADPELKKIVADIEDLKSCRKNCKDEEKCYKSCGRYEADGSMGLMHKKAEADITFVKRPLAISLSIGSESSVWIRPLTLEDLTHRIKELVLDAKVNIRFVVGNTSIGIYKNEGKFDAYIDSKEVKDLYQVSDSDNALTIGANVSLSDMIEEFKRRSTESEIFPVMSKHIEKVAHVPVRNVGSWVGNLMIKKLHPEFPSDIFTLFSAFNVTITVRDCVTGDDADYNLTGDNSFMMLNMTGKVVLTCKIPKTKEASGGKFKALSYKVMPRAQNAHAYVNGAFSASLNNGKIKMVSISFGGISKDFARATNTEKWLEGKEVNLQETLSGALKVLQEEVQPVSYSPVDSSPAYRKSLASGLFYKVVRLVGGYTLDLDIAQSSQENMKFSIILSRMRWRNQQLTSHGASTANSEMLRGAGITTSVFYLYLCDNLPAGVASAIETLERPVTSSTRTYNSDASMYPITEPIPKLTAIKQASGEAKYLSDSAKDVEELCATYVMADVGNADIDFIDSTVAETMPGFHSIITAADLPKEVKNTFMVPPFKPQVILADGRVDFAGQPVAIVLADSEFHAEEIAKSVVVTYKNKCPVVCDVEAAVEKGMIYEGGDYLEHGDADDALKNAKIKISGRAKLGGQYHFYMETHIAKATPTEDGFEIRCATQWQDAVQQACAYILGWDANRVNVRTSRIGGAYGGKAIHSLLTSTIATVSSYISGIDEEGLLQAIEATYYANSGSSSNDWEFSEGALAQFSDSGYYCPNWKLTAKNVRTDMSSTTWCRAPVSAQSAMFMEHVLEHVAKAVAQDPIVIKQKNLYKEGEMDISWEMLTNFKLREISQNLLTSVGVTGRQREIDAFNKENKWKKKGLGFTPLKFEFSWSGGCFSAQVSIYASDGSVILSSGAVDCGQGISTKLIQVAAYILGVPVDLIRVSEPTIVTTPNSAATSTSFTSEICSQAILECCKTLKSRIDESAKKLKLGDDVNWKDKIAKCFTDGVDLTATKWIYPKGDSLKFYNICGAAVSEVEMDILTGEYVIRKVDIAYDCGKSVNPEIDIGQAEGSFMFGVGYFTSEKLTFDPTSGKLLTNNTWEYKPPSSKDIPTEWNITFLKDDSNPTQTLSSKAVGEPPLLLSSSVVFAIKRCIESFRSDKSYFAIDLPATVANVQQLCGIKVTDYKLDI